MPSASALRIQIEAALRERIPSALTPKARTIRPVAPTGISTLDELLEGGLPIGAITEIVGQESSGRTSLALSFLAGIARTGRVCAWVDVSDALDPESAAAIGLDLNRLLWVRCGASRKTDSGCTSQQFALPEKYMEPPATLKGLHGGGHGPHPRTEIKGLSNAVGDFLRPGIVPSKFTGSNLVRGEGSQPFKSTPGKNTLTSSADFRSSGSRTTSASKPWSRIEQALRVTDLLLQAGGFSAIVLDMGSIAPENASRVPLATWFRYRAAAERTQASFLLLTQHACAKSSASLVLYMNQGKPLQDETTVFTGMQYSVMIQRERFPQNNTNVIPLRKPPQCVPGRNPNAEWQSRTPWVSRA